MCVTHFAAVSHPLRCVPLLLLRLLLLRQVVQVPTPKNADSVWMKQLRAEWHALVAQLAKVCGLSDELIATMHVQDEKVKCS